MGKIKIARRTLGMGVTEHALWNRVVGIMFFHKILNMKFRFVWDFFFFFLFFYIYILLGYLKANSISLCLEKSL